MSDHPKTDAAMPLIMALINSDVMPLIKRVIHKRVELYLREIEEQQRSATPESAPQGVE
jgi:hypothetical protein